MNKEPMGKDELMGELASMKKRTIKYWKKDMYGLGVPDSTNERWEKNIQSAERAYARLKEIVEDYHRIIEEIGERGRKADEKLTEIGLKIASGKQEKGVVGDYNENFCAECGTEFLSCCKTHISQARPRVTREELRKLIHLAWWRGLDNYIERFSELGVGVEEE